MSYERLKYLAVTDGTRSVVAQYQSDDRAEVEAWILENGPATLYEQVVRNYEGVELVYSSDNSRPNDLQDQNID